MSRFILHSDLDCFFAAVEIKDNPQYQGKPVIIGADPKDGKGRGVVSTCSYEARVFGLHSGMPISQAFQRCPHGIYLRPNFNKYNLASKQVMGIIKKYSQEFQQVGIDEAYLDLSDTCLNFNEAKEIAQKIQKKVRKDVGITISIGIAPTKSLAKIASDYKKPNGITLFTPDNFKSMLKDKDIVCIPGIGKKTKINFIKKGIKTIGDILNTPLHTMITLFGKQGKWIWDVANGIDNRKVKEFRDGRKSISAERTFFTDTEDFNEILLKITDINNKIHKTVIKHQLTYKTITLKIRFEGYQTFTRSKTLLFSIQDKNKVLDIILELFKEFSNAHKKVRLVGIRLSSLKKNNKIRQKNILNYIYA
ncbi:MAG: DNA polymerase IV [Promethearchaeota archaeon]|jgi:DNA polymerase IV (DinB-like DNA polymerase)